MSVAIGGSMTVTTRHRPLPATRAIFMHKLRVYDEPLGEVIALTLTLSGDVVVLSNSNKKVGKGYYSISVLHCRKQIKALCNRGVKLVAILLYK